MSDIVELTFNDNVVVMTNPLLTAQMSLTYIQTQLFEELIAKINPADKKFQKVTIHIKEFSHKIGCNTIKLYNEIDTIADDMIRAIKLRPNAKGDYASIPFLEEVLHVKGSGKVSLKLNEKLEPYLLEIKDSAYFKLHRNATRHIKNPHFSKLYWLLSSWRREKQITTITLSLEYVKLVMELVDNYPVFYDFKKYILNPAKTVFEKSGEFNFEYKEIRSIEANKKSPVEKIQFTISDNPKWSNKSNNNLIILPDENTIPEIDINSREWAKVITKLRNLSKSITKSQAEQFVKNYSFENPADILSEIINLNSLQNKGKVVTDHLAWLAEAVKNKFNKGLSEELATTNNNINNIETPNQMEVKKVNDIHKEYHEKTLNLIINLITKKPALIKEILDNMSLNIMGNVSLANYKKEIGEDYLLIDNFLSFLKVNGSSFYVSTLNYFTEVVSDKQILILQEDYKNKLKSK